MKSSTWKARIIESTRAVGTYKDAFLPAINALADILERRDDAYKEWMESGGETCIEKRSDRGAVNMGVNPRFRIWMDLNTQALAYWKDLGLTPSGLKKINEQSMKPRKVNALAEALRELG